MSSEFNFEKHIYYVTEICENLILVVNQIINFGEFNRFSGLPQIRFFTDEQEKSWLVRFDRPVLKHTFFVH